MPEDAVLSGRRIQHDPDRVRGTQESFAGDPVDFFLRCLKLSIKNLQGVPWLERHAPTAEGTGSIPDQGTKILQAMQCCQFKTKISNLTFLYMMDE